MYPFSIQKLIELLSKFPTVGQRTATRFAFYLLKRPQSEIDELLAHISQARKDILLCRFCCNLFDARGQKDETLCPLCQDTSRSRDVLCVVEKESDLEALEKTKEYRGLYFVLGGTVGTLTKQERESIRGKELKERVQNPAQFGIPSSFKEIIIALNPTTEGEATVLYLERALQPLGVRITKLGLGLPIGGELEYADEETLKQSLENRR